MYVILVYDICGEEKGQKVLNKTFKICKKYLTHVQKSVFEGNITDSQLVKLKYELQTILRKEMDSVLVFCSRNERWLDKQFWAKEDNLTSNFL